MQNTLTLDLVFEAPKDADAAALVRAVRQTHFGQKLNVQVRATELVTNIGPLHHLCVTLAYDAADIKLASSGRVLHVLDGWLAGVGGRRDAGEPDV